MDLEKTYDTIDLYFTYKMLIVYGVWEKLMKRVQSVYVGSRGNIRVGMGVSEWFLANVGLR